jgi:hypothetical protein
MLNNKEVAEDVSADCPLCGKAFLECECAPEDDDEDTGLVFKGIHRIQ